MGLRKHCINADACRESAALLHGGNPSLHIVWLGKNNIDDEGVPILVDALRNNMWRVQVNWSFCDCKHLNDVELPSVETIGEDAFVRCTSLRRIAIPLKNNMFTLDKYQQYYQFCGCENLTVVDLVGGIHNTAASLLLESWRNEMKQEIDRINQEFPHIHED